ncbi:MULTISPECIES: endolytic transglycosylase MltG [unclassified Microbacterium]|uniref:endolytic transglycosylase MltG n=1 Tax=unclassified Microbacterium TaxID=2609290 RepID=UPI003016EDDC
MPDTPSNDDQFADLFSRLPSAARRSDASSADGARDDSAVDPADRDAAARVAGPSTAPDTAPVPGSRRAARAAAADGAGATAPPRTATGSGAADPVPGVLPTVPAGEPEGPRAGRTGADATPAPTSIDALFVDEPDGDERARIARHHRDRRKSRIAGWVVFGIVLAIVGGIAAGGFVVWTTYEDKIRAFMGWEEPKDYEEGIAEGDATVTIVSGDTGSTISTSLFNAGVTKTSAAFYDYLVSTRQNPTFQPGVYALKQKMTSAAALVALQDPASRRDNTAQLPEGLTIDQTLQRLADGTGIPLSDLQAAVADPSAYGVSAQSLEGWLFPATYTFDPGTSATQVIQTLVDRTVQSLDTAGVPADQRETILTIASIIQREARFTADFYKVSRVIQNRLQPDNEETHGKLQMDSTAQYGYGEIHKGTASSSAEALEDDNPWNTYVHAGLPIGPIANPGDLAIDAAMHPADGPWLYFVTVNLDTGETVFSTTYAEHEKAVAQWQEWCAANDSDDC